jgi:predicted RND superfamily exporter protein
MPGGIDRSRGKLPSEGDGSTPPTAGDAPPRARPTTIAWRVARFAVAHQRLAYSIVALTAVVSALTIAFGVKFASDVLDLLPQHFGSVQVFKTYDREFSQARELTFGVHDESGEADLEEFTDQFAQALRAEPWVVRVMDRSPIESAQGAEEVQSVALPLLLNLPPEEFQSAVAALAPQRIEARLARLRQELEAGSPKAALNEFDPLGLVGPALKPIAGSFSLEQTRPLASPDGTLRVIMVVTDQDDLGAESCQQTMAKVDAVKAKMLAEWQGTKPEILVTGRTPYVAELSLKMRSDVISTLTGSAVLVAVVFWIGFRRVRPLIAIVHALVLCCLVAVALGAVIFHELNMITIGLCSILIGLGVDFGMMLYGIYENEREAGHSHEEGIARALEHHSHSIVFGALTTAAAFLCLLRSDCTGFQQLGVLIALGIIFAGFFMMTAFFVFLGGNHRPRGRDTLKQGGHRFVRAIFEHPKAVSLAGTIVLLLLTGYALSPWAHLRFEANPRSLEPQKSVAGHALRTITGKMPGLGEPVIALLQSTDADRASNDWKKLQEKWQPMVESGVLRSVATPSAFAVSPARLQANLATLQAEQVTAAEAALRGGIEFQGMREDSFTAAFAFLQALHDAKAGDEGALSWKETLPQSSSWWFILDRFFGANPLVAVGYVTPAAKLVNHERTSALEKELAVPGVDIRYSGWTYTLTQLVPWAKSKLLELTLLMIGFNVLLLTFMYRRLFPLLVLMAGLALSVGALVATLHLLGVTLNLFNVLAFPLVLGVGVDYGIYVVSALRAPGEAQVSVTTIMKPLLLSGLTTMAGFASLAMAQNPALRGLGIVCALGVAWALFATFFFVLPLYVWRRVR